MFLLTKQPRYWFDAEAVREDGAGRTDLGKMKFGGRINGDTGWHNDGGEKQTTGRNVRTVWNIATQPYPEAHFATFPEELARRCILAGCPTRVCRECGKPSERIVERGVPSRQVDPSEIDRYGNGDAGVHRKVGGQYQKWLDENPAQTVGWSDCGCLLSEGVAKRNSVGINVGQCIDRDALGTTPSASKWRPGLVLDPFIGSGTVAKVARDHGRHAIGIDLSADYLELAARRLQQLSLLT